MDANPDYELKHKKTKKKIVRQETSKKKRFPSKKGDPYKDDGVTSMNDVVTRYF